MPQAGHSFPAERESKPNPWINTSFALTPTPKSEPRNWWESQETVSTFLVNQVKALDPNSPWRIPFLQSGSEIWVLNSPCFQPRFVLTSCFSIQQNKQGQPYLQDAHFGVEPLQLHSQPFPLLGKILPCIPKLRSRPDLPPSRGPWGTVATTGAPVLGSPGKPVELSLPYRQVALLSRLSPSSH